jgi:hypothetical protein
MNHGILYNVLKAIKPLRALVRRLRSFWQRYRLEAWVLEGAERNSGEPIRVLFVGQVENCNYLARVLFAEDSVRRYRQRVWSWQVDSLLNGPVSPYGMIFVQQQPGARAWYSHERCFVLPSWLAGELNVAQGLDSRRGNDSVKTDLRNIRRNGFTYRITCEPQDIEYFYTTMYLPYIQQTHGDRAFVTSREELGREAGDRLELLLIEQDGKPVAGVYLGMHDQERVDALELGVAGADRNLVRLGALAAIYYYALVYAAEGNYLRLYLGGSRPFLHDGALQYKKKWGLRIVGRLQSLPDVLVFQPRLGTAAVRSFLLNNPFVFEQDGVFRAAVFIGAQQESSDKSTDQIRKAYCFPGLAGVTVFRVDGNALGQGEDVAPSAQPGVVLEDAPAA